MLIDQATRPEVEAPAGDAVPAAALPAKAGAAAPAFTLPQVERMTLLLAMLLIVGLGILAACWFNARVWVVGVIDVTEPGKPPLIPAPAPDPRFG